MYNCLLSALLFPAVALAFTTTRPSQIVDAVSRGARFNGKENRVEEFLTYYLDDASKTLFVGSRDVVYNISLEQFKSQSEQEWATNPKGAELCTMKGKSKDECHNYIRVLGYDAAKRQLFVCGTHAYNPKCQIYSLDNGWKLLKQLDGFGIAPYDPDHKSTAVLLPSQGRVYSGSVADYAATDALIYGKMLEGGDAQQYGVRTERNNARLLYEPRFIGSHYDDDYVFFWFYENTYDTTSCNPGVVPRVARVCRSDEGGPRPYNDIWTTYLKARLNCSIGNPPFYYDQIEAISNVVDSASGPIIYGIFSTPYSDFKKSAVCAFRMQSVREKFENGNINIQASAYTWNQHSLRDDSSNRRPGSCSTDSRTLGENAMIFMKSNPVMDGAIKATFDGPLFLENNMTSLPSAIAVDQVSDVEGHRLYDVLFVGTESGQIRKIVHRGSAASSIYVESVNVFASGSKIVNLALSKGEPKSLVAISAREIAKVPLHHCDSQKGKTCSGCVQLRDPYCAWDVDAGRCMHSTNWKNGNYAQDVETGVSDKCPVGEPIYDEIPETVTKADCPPPVVKFVEKPHLHRRHTKAPLNPEPSLLLDNSESSSAKIGIPVLIGAALGAALLAGLLGFLAGYHFRARKAAMKPPSKGKEKASPKSKQLQKVIQANKTTPSPSPKMRRFAPSVAIDDNLSHLSIAHSLYSTPLSPLLNNVQLIEMDHTYRRKMNPRTPTNVYATMPRKPASQQSPEGTPAFKPVKAAYV